MALTPYVVGQWVRGDGFYGRGELLDRILNGNRNCLWLLGTRRIGKTSVLKQLEHMTIERPETGWFPLFWDLQGSDEPADLDESFAEALLDAADRLEDVGIREEDLAERDLFESLGRLRRELRNRKLKLLLLCDEVEELINVNRQDRRFLRRLRRALQSAEGIRTVLASNIKLWELSHEETTSTSPFLQGFTPPLYVSGLREEEARELILQTNLPPDARPEVADDAMETIRLRTDRHPYLLQVLCERFRMIADLDRAIEEIATDEMVTHFFSVDFGLLSEVEREVVRVVAGEDLASSEVIQGRVGVESSSLVGSLQRLEQMGFLTRSEGGGYRLANYFFRRWCTTLTLSEPSRLGPVPPTVRVKDDRGGTTDDLGRLDNRYELLSRLGAGAIGDVYKARDTLLDSVIAIKILKPTFSGDVESMERLRREVLLSRELAHDNIVRIYHLEESEGVRYVTMEYVDGDDLAVVLGRDGPFPTDRLLDVARKLSDALTYAHERNVLHRDIKPSNVLMDGLGEPRMADFGLARLLGSPTITQAGVFLGTPAYASPEQARAQSLDQRSDIYAFGVLLFEMATGRRPFTEDSVAGLLAAHMTEEPPVPSSLLPSLPCEFDELVLRCLAKAPADRFQAASELSEALGAIG